MAWFYCNWFWTRTSGVWPLLFYFSIILFTFIHYFTVTQHNLGRKSIQITTQSQVLNKYSLLIQAINGKRNEGRDIWVLYMI